MGENKGAAFQIRMKNRATYSLRVSVFFLEQICISPYQATRHFRLSQHGLRHRIYAVTHCPA